MITRLKNNKGITLIALIITIIVLLILAGVSIIMLTGENGILTQAQKSSTQTDIGKEKEYIALAYNGAKVENNGRDVDAEDLNRNFEYNDTNATASGTNPITVEFNDSHRTYTIDENGTILGPDTGSNTPPATDGDGFYTKDSTMDGKTTGSATNPIIPAGFKPITDNVDEGLVIQDAQLNEFVWVPVDFREFEREHFGTEEQKWWTGTFVTDKISEKNMYEPTANGETNGTEVEQMYKSVKDNGGFYIGRYEAGKDKIDETKAVSQKGVEVYNNIKWGNSMTEENGGAVEKARNFDTQSGHTNITSTLVYGVQWDAIMRWISNDNNFKAYLTDSSGIGNYSEILNSTTGANDTYQMKNIYDLAGNVSEWTMEAHSTSNRVDRGGGYDFLSDGSPCSFRNGSSWDSNAPDLGFRIAFFLQNKS